ncbi:MULTISPECIES: hypothetical protein [Bradyrhizobium]|jgi:hypothetical protein|uniref:Uncharacterized protein n=1 Tax=Bradyrhizobium elkanii TaxID=29448 RepID=A0A8I1YP20_BRAEL|nr:MULTISPECIES: hypothetical protein [Bradyrhizobium]MBP1299718.1 hypothetical protein [Bradyrhizobium elkanii]MCP1972014.1 hypothetical protein [Bradyrhizobium elkanii]MCS3452253.1 hypothetical protein [Bradyrhizobium elkanii]MCS3519177.1 hypothetical protein [Bradyrhizobium elkanii]MCS3565645.1 hypothetical protein [Bradyrhizobium elkanii]
MQETAAQHPAFLQIEYFIETTSAYLSGRSAFFTDDKQAAGMLSAALMRITSASVTLVTTLRS